MMDTWRNIRVSRESKQIHKLIDQVAAQCMLCYWSLIKKRSGKLQRVGSTILGADVSFCFASSKNLATHNVSMVVVSLTPI